MSLFSEEEVNKAAEKYSHNEYGDALEWMEYVTTENRFQTNIKDSYKAGIEFAESKIAELAIEFLAFADSSERHLFDNNELFQEFLKQRNNG